MIFSFPVAARTGVAGRMQAIKNRSVTDIQYLIDFWNMVVSSFLNNVAICVGQAPTEFCLLSPVYCLLNVVMDAERGPAPGAG